MVGGAVAGGSGRGRGSCGRRWADPRQTLGRRWADVRYSVEPSRADFHGFWVIFQRTTALDGYVDIKWSILQGGNSILGFRARLESPQGLPREKILIPNVPTRFSFLCTAPHSNICQFFVFIFAIFSTKFHHFLRILNQFHVFSSRF